LVIARNVLGMARHGDDEQEYKQAMYADVINDPSVRELAWRLADAARSDGDPQLAAVDRGGRSGICRSALSHAALSSWVT
jgi:hypothetical protein